MKRFISLGIIGAVLIIATILIITFLPLHNTKPIDDQVPATTLACTEAPDVNGCFIKTEYFELQLPDFWEGNFFYDYSYEGTQIKLTVKMFTETDERGAHLFSIYLIPLDETDEIRSALEWALRPLYVLDTNTGLSYFVGYRMASEMPCAEHEEELFLQMVDSIPEFIDDLIATDVALLSDWSESYIDDTPYADITLSVLGRDFQSFCNQSGEMIYVTENTEYIKYFNANLDDTVTYYASADNELIGVKNDSIVFYGIITDELTSEFSSPSVRDVINIYDLSSLFDISPSISAIYGQPANLYYWRINNGYVGIVGLGQADPDLFYSYSSRVFISSSILELISID